MFRNGVDTISLVINFLNKSWTPMHIIVSLFEMNETIQQSMAMQFESLFLKFALMHYVITYVKGKGNNLTSMVSMLCSIIDCELLNLSKVYIDTCFGHVMLQTMKKVL